MLRNLRKAVTVAVAVAASFAFFVPVATADEIGTMHYSCGQPRPPQLDGSAFRSAITSTDVRRGSSSGCGSYGLMLVGDQLDYYCYTLGNDGNTWTYLSVFEEGFAGWAMDNYLPVNPDGETRGSVVHCPI